MSGSSTMPSVRSQRIHIAFAHLFEKLDNLKDSDDINDVISASDMCELKEVTDVDGQHLIECDLTQAVCVSSVRTEELAACAERRLAKLMHHKHLQIQPAANSLISHLVENYMIVFKKDESSKSREFRLKFYFNALERLGKHPNVDFNLCILDGTFCTLCEWIPDESSIKYFQNILKLILTHKHFNVNQEDSKGFTPLIISTHKKNVVAVKEILKHPLLDVNQFDRITGRSAITWARLFHVTDVMVELVNDDRVNVNACDILGVPPLVEACTNGQTEIVQILLKNRNIDVNIYTRSGDAFPLYAAVENTSVSIMKLLMGHKDININQAIGEKTVLYCACVLEPPKPEIVAQLLTHPDINVNRGAPLVVACVSRRYLSVAKKLLEHKDIDVNIVATDEKIISTYGATPLYVACEWNNLEGVKLLLEREELNVNHLNKHGNSALHAACTVKRGEDKHELVELLLKHNADVNSQELYPLRETVLFTACESFVWYSECKLKTVALLLDHGANVNEGDQSKGITPLMLACRTEEIELLDLLLHQETIDVNFGCCLIELCNSPYATRQALIPIQMLLNHPRINVNIYGFLADELRNPLMTACALGRPTFIKALLTHKNIRVNIQTTNGDSPRKLFEHTPLIHTCIHHYPACVEELLKHPKIEINQTQDETESGKTALWHACHTQLKPQERQNKHIKQNAIKVLTLLLKHPKLNVNAVYTTRGASTTVLYDMCKFPTEDHKSYFPLLLNHADIAVNSENNTWKATPLFAVCNGNHRNLALADEFGEALLRHDHINPNKGTAHGATPLGALCRKIQYPKPKTFEQMLKHPDTEVNKLSRLDDDICAPPLFICIRYYSRYDSHVEERIRALLAHPKIEINKPETKNTLDVEERRSTLQYACQRNVDSEIVKMLLEHTDINVNKGTATPLMEICKGAEAAEAEFNAMSSTWNPEEIKERMINAAQIVELLLNAGADKTEVMKHLSEFPEEIQKLLAEGRDTV